MHVPTDDDVDALIARYHTGSAKQQHDLIVLLSVHPISFSEGAWSWLSDLARQPEHELRHVLFRMLARADESRFGRMLAAQAWSWDPKAHLWVNDYGSAALFKAVPALPFDQLAQRLAPWRLLEAARVRGADPADVRLAAEIFGHVLAAHKIEEPDPGSTLTADRTEKNFPLYVTSAKPRPGPDEQDTPIDPLDPDARAKAHVRAFEIATVRIDEARKSGASLYLTNIEAVDMEPVLQHAPDMLERWLEGYRERTTDFRRRVHLAETAFLALCEALLIRDPKRGVELWQALRATIATQYIGAAGVDELLNVVFRVPDSAPVGELRKDLSSLWRCHTDQMLFDIAVAASYNGKAAWLASAVGADQASPLVWRQKRGAVLAGFAIGNTLPVPEAWPEGEIRTSHAELQSKAAGFRWCEACARHWWHAYLAAPDAVTAYSAWVLFLRSADRRALVWMQEDANTRDRANGFFDFKLAHAQLNRSELKREMGKRLDRAEKKFLYHDIVDGIGPWRTTSDAD